MLNTARSQLKPYGIALLAVISTLLLTRLLESLLTPTVFILFFPAVVVSALYGGMNSGLLASILSAFVCKFFFLPPVYSLAISDLGTGVRLGIFLLVTLLITTTSSALRTARHRVEISLLKLRASEERYRVLAENVPQLVWITRADGFVDYFNQRWFNYTGLKPEQTLGWDWQQVVHPEDLPSTLEQWTTGLTTGNPFEIHYRLKGADGIYRWHIGRALPLRNPNGEIVNWFGTCTDIHDQKQVAEEVRQSQERLGFLANASRLLATSLDYETTLTNVARLAMPYLADVCAVDLVEENEPPVGQTLRRVAVAHIDPSKEELLYEIAHRYPPVAIALSPVKKALESGQSVLLSDVAESALADDAQDAEHLKLIRDIGSFCSTIIVPLIARGRTIGTILLGTTDSGRHYNSSDLCLAEDFAQRIALAVDNARLYWETQEAERRKDESLALLDAFLSSTPVGFAFFDRQRRYIRINDYLAAINGIPAAEHLGRTVGEILPPELALLVDIRHQQVLETGEPVLNVEESGETLAARNPESYWLSSYYPVRSSAEELLGIGMAVTEITERKQAQERIQLYADVVKNAQVGIVVWQLEDWENPGSFRLITSNPAACQFTDVDFESLVGTTMAESFPTLTKTHLIREYVEVVRTGEPKDLGEVRYEDERITAGIFSLKAFPLPHRCLGLAFENITQRKYVEEALRDALQKLNFHVENTPLAVIERDRNFCITRWSQGAERIFGWKAEDVIGKGLNELEFVFVEDKEAVNALRLRLINGDETHNISNNRSYRKDGSVVYCEWYNSALLDESGNLVSVLSLVLDVTERKQAELERINLLEREKTARTQAETANRIKDEFLAVLSHELRSPLNPILGWSKLLQSRKLDEKTVARGLETIERNAKLQTQLIEDLLDVSRILRGKLTLNVCPIDLVSTIEAALETVRLAACAKSIEIRMVYEPNVGQVLGDPNRLQQVVWNLLSNAIKFTPAGGRVEVRLSTHCDWKDTKPNSKSSAFDNQSNNLKSNYAQIQVSDTGKGINAEFLPYVFDYFRQENSSTTRSFGGLGLGLAIVRHLVELHGGTVKAESLGEGQGATFTVRLPLTATQPEMKPSKQDYENAPDLSGIRILVVDDEADMREFLAFTLEGYGAEVIVVSSAAEALEALCEVKPDVLLSDVGMPEVDGYMLIRQIRAMPPERGGQIRAIALTAYAGETDQTQALSAGFQKHVAKPVEPAELAAVVASLIRG